jgi:hypothetical protein
MLVTLALWLRDLASKDLGQPGGAVAMLTARTPP